MSIPDTHGVIPFSHPSLPRECQTWYRVLGDLGSGKRPLVAVHGGPGGDHEYMLLGLAAIPAQTGRPLILYDQIGGGRTTRYPDMAGDATFWSGALFLAELDNLLRRLGVRADFDLVGHSWGGMLGAAYAAAVPAGSGPRHLVVACAPASLDLWMRAVDGYVARLPDATRRTIVDGDERRPRDDAFAAAMMELHARHLCPLPWPAEVRRFFGGMAADPTVRDTKYGAHELRCSGELKDWNMVESCKSIKVPTLVLHGELDYANAEAVEPWVKGIAGAKWVTMKGCTHFPQAEKPDEYRKHILDFLES